jgi:hypothetical protein
MMMRDQNMGKPLGFGVGHLVRYRHDHEKVGMIIAINNQRKDRLLVLWQRSCDGRQQWYVEPSWVEVINGI